MENAGLLEALGLTKEELQERIIDNAVETLLSRKGCDDDEFESTLVQKIGTKIEAKLNQVCDAFIEKTVGPHVTAHIENAVLHPTDNWGNSKGDPKTFTEYVIARFDAYLKERVNNSGEVDRYRDNTIERGAWLVTKHIRGVIEQIIKDSIGTALATIKGGIEGQIKSTLDRTFVEVSTKVTEK